MFHFASCPRNVFHCNFTHTTKVIGYTKTLASKKVHSGFIFLPNIIFYQISPISNKRTVKKCYLMIVYVAVAIRNCCPSISQIQLYIIKLRFFDSVETCYLSQYNGNKILPLAVNKCDSPLVLLVDK